MNFELERCWGSLGDCSMLWMVESRNERAGPGSQVLAALGPWGFPAGKWDSVGKLKRPDRCEEKRPWGDIFGGFVFFRWGWWYVFLGRC
jgi:hypothetical protein